MTDPAQIDDGGGIAQVLLAIARIDRRLNTLIDGEPGPIVRLREAMKMTGCNSPGAFQKFKTDFGITAINRGRFSRMEIENAVARRVHEKNLKATKPITD